MDSTRLSIFGRGETFEKQLNPEGTIIGRIPPCDVVIDSRKLSRKHVRLFQDPFGRWIVEDLGSSNGTFINGKRIKMCPVLPGELIVIDPFYMFINEASELQIKPDPLAQQANIVIEDFETEVFSDKIDLRDLSLRACPDKLNEFTNILSGLTSPSGLYPEVCRFLGRSSHTVAIILRIPTKNEMIPMSSEFLACYFGDDPYDTTADDTDGYYPSLPVLFKNKAFRVSHRVLEAVMNTKEIMMDKAIYSSDEDITSAFIDEHTPRAIICTPLGTANRTLDVLYVDIPLEDRMKSTLEELFAFIRDTAQVIVTNRKRLILMQLKAERAAIDHELSLAQDIQSKFVPQLPDDLSNVDVGVAYKPVMWVGGDYCDVWNIVDGRLAFAVGKVSERGLRGAVGKAKMKCALKTAMDNSCDLQAVIQSINRHFIQFWPEGLSASLFLGLLDTATGKLEYVNAGHPEPLVIEPNLVIETLGKQELANLGSSNAEWRPQTITILKGAALTVFSPGIIDAKSPKGENFGIKRLAHYLKVKSEHSAQELANSVMDAVVGFQQKFAQQDDLTIVVLANHSK